MRVPPEPTRALRRLLLHERTQMAVKAAVAATLAWFAAELFSSDLTSYRYYAPLGAVVTTYPTVATSVRHSLHAALAIAIGGALGLLVQAMSAPNAVALVVVVAVGVALAGLPFLGDQRSYVPIVALLVLVIGGSDAGEYAVAYLALTILGAGIGVAVTFALPALRLTRGQEGLRELQRLLADQLEDLAAGLREPARPPGEGWQASVRSATPGLEGMRAGVLEAADAQRGNPRARRHGYAADHQREIGRGLERVALLVEDLTDVLVGSYSGDRPSHPVDPELADVLAGALDRLAAVVRVYHLHLEPDDARVLDARASVGRLTEAFAARRDLEPHDVALLGAVVANLDRCLAVVLPR